MERKLVLGLSQGNSSDDVENNKLKNVTKGTSTNENLKENQFSRIKKKDCYYEQKIFNEIDNVLVPILAEAEVKVKLESKIRNILEHLTPVLNDVIFIPFGIIGIICIIYILIKIVKYERIKAGKGELKDKEYVCFCKEDFNIN
ncbi:VIR-like CYIR protein [Plasmodium cynomolgi strain B]|uniref:VIR-like CYIR protein n=1 Tax=Plasmodium cynomolgi (strain B) TaxID=1120755 RepID=K6UST1_PLACD|nr:VIR-like CYIR protein [Plasmodium cynomolgi strain B]GAB66314.1 VIR-like CYIR protein [Plasmodium cynomolgi strain B]